MKYLVFTKRVFSLGRQTVVGGLCHTVSLMSVFSTLLINDNQVSSSHTVVMNKMSAASP